MIFTFWSSDSGSPKGQQIPESVHAWRQEYPDMQVYSDDDAIDALRPFGDEYVVLFRRIQLPSCKADIARLLLLYRFGGFYVDSHIGPGDPRGVARIFSKLGKYDLVLFDKSWDRNAQNPIRLINGVMCARRGAAVLQRLIQSVLRNLQIHEQSEYEANAYVSYNLVVLTGAWNIRMQLFNWVDGTVVLKDEFSDHVFVMPIENKFESGVVLYKFYGYRKEGRHWSERQLRDRLFDPRPSLAG